jgi:hypothetical protein
VLGTVLLDRRAGKFGGERIDVLGIKIEPEGIAPGNKPSLDRVGQMQMAALAVGQHAVAVLGTPRRLFAVRPGETEPVIEGLRGIEIVAGQDGNQRVRWPHRELLT